MRRTKSPAVPVKLLLLKEVIQIAHKPHQSINKQHVPERPLAPASRLPPSLFVAEEPFLLVSGPDFPV